jgi:hypothetical protein
MADKEKDDKEYMTTFETITDSIYKVMILIFCSLMAGIGFGIGSTLTIKILEMYKVWIIN